MSVDRPTASTQAARFRQPRDASAAHLAIGRNAPQRARTDLKMSTRRPHRRDPTRTALSLDGSRSCETRELGSIGLTTRPTPGRRPERTSPRPSRRRERKDIAPRVEGQCRGTVRHPIDAGNHRFPSAQRSSAARFGHARRDVDPRGGGDTLKCPTQGTRGRVIDLTPCRGRRARLARSPVGSEAPACRGTARAVR